MKIKTARHVVRWFLRKTGYGAITMPWQTVYALPERVRDAGLIRHELVHVEQIKRLGAGRWTWQYLIGLVRYGYKENPLEVEARKKSGAAKRGERNHNYGRVWSTQGRGKRTPGVDFHGNPIMFRSTWEKNLCRPFERKAPALDV